jgi:hypothetical protein
VAGAIIGAVVDAVVQYNQTGNVDWGEVGMSAIEGAAIAVGVAVAAPMVIGLAGEALAGVGLMTGSTTLFSAGMSTYALAGATSAIVYGSGSLASQINNVRSPSSIASSWQGKGKYPGVDDWDDDTLPKGSTVYGGTPGQNGFYTNQNTLDDAGNDATKINEGLQIKPASPFEHPTRYRPNMTQYEVLEDTKVATSKALANPNYGSGGYTQYYIPQWKTNLQPVNTIPLTNYR